MPRRFTRKKQETDKEGRDNLREGGREGRAQLLCEEKIKIKKARRCTSVKGEGEEIDTEVEGQRN